jgi:Fe-S oxidoreductase
MTRGEVIADGWNSDSVEDALSLCLACKGCKSDCPVGVDVASWKAEFRSHHYAHKRRPRSAYSMGQIDRWANLASYAPGLVNSIAKTRPAKWLAGVDRRARLPRFSSQTFRDWFRQRGSRAMSSERLLLWPDTFNNHFRPRTLIAATQLLERAGFRVEIPAEALCCGRPLYDWGFLDQAKERFERCFRVLTRDLEAGTPIVTLEPACASTFKDELRNLFPDRAEAERLSACVHYFADFALGRIDRFPKFLCGGSALVQAHCHHHSVIGFTKEAELLGKLELSVERPSQGCCGMAGAFGIAKESFEVGRKIGERVLLRRVRELDADTIIIADGFSCREQIEMNGGRGTMHVAELLRERMI